MEKKTVYVVLAVQVDKNLNNDEIDTLLNNAEFDVKGEGVTYKEVVENQFNYYA